MDNIPQNLFDLAQCELAQYQDDSAPENKSRIIIHDDKYIYLFLKASGSKETATYTPDLYHFMARPSCCSYSYDYKRGRVQIELMTHKRSGNRYKPTLGAFLYAWYQNIQPLDDFLQNVPIITRESSIDHANADKHNHCDWNLSRVSVSQNSKKEFYHLRSSHPIFAI